MKILQNMRIRKLLNHARMKGRKEERTIRMAEMDHLMELHETQLKKQRQRYDALIKSRDEEILRLHKVIDGKREAFNECREFEGYLKDISYEVSDKFDRAFQRFAEGLQLVKSAQEQLDFHDRAMEKRTPKLLKVL